LRYSLAELIDMLTIINLKIFMLVDEVEKGSDPNKVSKAAKKTQELNRRRSELKNAINEIADNIYTEVKI
jgi:hypothetical protein